MIRRRGFGAIFPKMIPLEFVWWRKASLYCAAALGFLYAFSVVWYVPSTPDIGIYCAFTPVVKRLSPELNPETSPSVGDNLVQVGRYRFPDETQPHPLWAQVRLQRELQDLRSAKMVPLPADRRHLLTNPRFNASLLESAGIEKLTYSSEQVDQFLEGPGGEPVAVQRLDGQKEVLVKFKRARSDQIQEVWRPLGSMPVNELIPSLLWFFLKLGLFTVGALVFWKRPQDGSAAQFFLLCIVTLVAYMGGYHWMRIATQPWLVVVFMACGVFLPAVSLHFYLVFPRAKEILQRYPWEILVAMYGIPAAFLAILLMTYFQLRGMVYSPFSELAVTEAWTKFNREINVYLGAAALYYLLSVLGLIHSYRTAANFTERKQVQWILIGALAALVPIGYTLYLIISQLDDFGAGAATWPMFAASVCFTVAYAISITRYRLMELDQIISSGMIYFLLSFLAGLVYYVIAIVGMLVGGVIHVNDLPSFTQALPVVTTAFLLLLSLDLVRGRVKRALDRRFSKEKYKLDRTLQRMGQAIEQLVDPPTLARHLLQATGELLGVSQGAVYLREGTPPLYRLAGSLGSPPPLTELPPGCPLLEALQLRKEVLATRQGLGAGFDPAQRQLRFLGGEIGFPLTHEGQVLAFLVLGAKQSGVFGPENVNLLSAFAQLTVPALQSAERLRTIEALNNDLRSKVEKISEQQRRILALQSQLTGQSARNSEEPSETSADDKPFLVPSPASNGAGRSQNGIIGSSLPVRRLLELARKVSATQSAVLIRGESGTGKELLARALHANSSRAEQAFVKVHCAALSPGLLESELFGHVKGAFTGAHRDKVGRFELADGGTLFLDEIGDITLDVQTKLLRVLQEKTFERVGSSEPLQVDVRIIAATHQNLEELIHQGRFREDLYYRLKVIDIRVPSLRERREDIPELALHFLQIYARRCDKRVEQIDDDAMAMLKSYRWPGNIRELENVIERAVVVAEGPTIMAGDLSPEITRNFEAVPFEGTAPSPSANGLRAEREEFDRREREQLVRALATAGGNKAEAARALGMARSTLLSRLKKYGLQ
jgi:transcriptional regulator with GAF, ATPase, and Fis domain